MADNATMFLCTPAQRQTTPTSSTNSRPPSTTNSSTRCASRCHRRSPTARKTSARRDHAVIARIAAFRPANAAEADVVALYVAASERWKDCLRLAQQSETSSYWAQKCRAQANSMMRQAQSALRLLLRMQAARQKLEVNSEARDRAAWTEQCAIGPDGTGAVTAARAGGDRRATAASIRAATGTRASGETTARPGSNTYPAIRTSPR